MTIVIYKLASFQTKANLLCSVLEIKFHLNQNETYEWTKIVIILQREHHTSSNLSTLWYISVKWKRKLFKYHLSLIKISTHIMPLLLKTDNTFQTSWLNDLIMVVIKDYLHSSQNKWGTEWGSSTPSALHW